MTDNLAPDLLKIAGRGENEKILLSAEASMFTKGLKAETRLTFPLGLPAEKVRTGWIRTDGVLVLTSEKLIFGQSKGIFAKRLEVLFIAPLNLVVSCSVRRLYLRSMLAVMVGIGQVAEIRFHVPDVKKWVAKINTLIAEKERLS